MTIFAKVYVDEDIDVLVAHLLVASGFEIETIRLEFANGSVYASIVYNELEFLYAPFVPAIEPSAESYQESLTPVPLTEILDYLFCFIL